MGLFESIGSGLGGGAGDFGSGLDMVGNFGIGVGAGALNFVEKTVNNVTNILPYLLIGGVVLVVVLVLK